MINASAEVWSPCPTCSGSGTVPNPAYDPTVTYPPADPTATPPVPPPPSPTISCPTCGKGAHPGSVMQLTDLRALLEGFLKEAFSTGYLTWGGRIT